MVVGLEQKGLTEKKLLANIEQPCYYDADKAEKMSLEMDAITVGLI